MAALLAGGLYVATTTIGLLELRTTLVNYASEALLAVALLSSLGGFYGLYRAHQGPLGRIGLFGFAVAFIGTALMGAVATANIVVGHAILDQIYLLGILIWHTGGTVFGLAMLWVGVRSWRDGSWGGRHILVLDRGDGPRGAVRHDGLRTRRRRVSPWLELGRNRVRAVVAGG